MNAGSHLTNTSDYVNPLGLIDGSSNTSQRPLLKDGETLKQPLTMEEQKNMSTSIIDMFRLEEDEKKENGETGEEDEDVEEVVDVEDRARRIERLMKALPMLAHLWWQGSVFIDEATEKLADGARDCELSI